MRSSKSSKTKSSKTKFSGTEIKPANLKNTSITPDDILLVKKLLRKLLFKNILLSFLPLMPILYLSSAFFKGDNSFFDEFPVFTVVVLLLSLFAFLYLVRQIYCLITYNYKKGQYGVVKNKRTSTVQSNEAASTTSFYVTVSFKNTFIKNISCNVDTYYDVSVGERVLVVTFNNRTAHVISLN